MQIMILKSKLLVVILFTFELILTSKLELKEKHKLIISTIEIN